MRISKDQIPAKINVPGAIARQATDFGDATGYGKMGGEYFSLGAGTDIAPLLKGLKDDACHAPHWGYMLAGRARRHVHGRQDRDVQGERPLLLAARPQRARRQGRRGHPVQPAARALRRHGPHAERDEGLSWAFAGSAFAWGSRLKRKGKP